jgi:uncharacterized protein YbjT (DUF2867 family)
MNILVTGATGNVGAHVVGALHERGSTPRAFVRDRARAEQVLGPRVELAIGDHADRDSIGRAVRGTDRLFLACGNTLGQVDFERAVIDAALAEGVSQVVKLSGPNADVDSPLIFERWHGQIEEHLRASGLPAVLLRPRTYMTNLLAYAPTIAATNMVFAPAGAAAISFVDPRDVADAAAAALVEDGHAGQTYTLTGPEAMTFERVAEDLSAVLGRRIGYVDVPDDAARHGMIEAGLPPMMADAIVDIFRSQRGGSMTDTTDTLRTLIGRDAGTFARFAQDHAAAFRPDVRDHASAHA